METNKMRDISREQFEAVALSPEGGLRKGHLVKGEDGEYLNYAVQCYWMFWQASRQSAAVELPDVLEIGGPLGIRYFTEREVHSAIAAQGLKVAQ